MQKTDPLIRTKLRVPSIRPNTVIRPRLLDQIAHGLHGPLTLISAPAGSGKTTIVASTIAACTMQVAWISLDRSDNQVERFLGYLTAAFSQLDPAYGGEAAQLLAAPQPAPPEVIFTSLINDLDQTRDEIVLVLDDYQFIKSQAVHNALVFMLEHQPQTLHIVVVTRADPPLPLARLRARGQLVELRVADLRFTVSEAAQFMNGVMGLNLDPESIEALAGHTEGWIAGLQMAALSMRDRTDVPGFLQNFSGSHRYIMDYMLEEVLNSQPADIHQFLLSTSILDHFCGPLCDAVLESGESRIEIGEKKAASLHSPLSILDYLDRSNLFLIPLDDERRWYRYHHLFADLLRARLHHLAPELESHLHKRAGRWFENEGMLVEAINHTLAAGDHEHAARLVEGNTSQLLARGEIHALMGWIEALPAEIRQVRPWLCIHQAYALAFAGQLDKVEPLLAQAEAALLPAAMGGDGAGVATRDQKALEGALAALRAMAAVMTGRDADAVHLANLAQQRLPPESLWDRATNAWALGYAQRSLGHLSEASAAFQEQIQLGRAMGNIWTLVSALTDLAQVRRNQGSLRDARELFEEALHEASQQGARRLGYIARMEAGLAGILYEQNELESAGRLLSDAAAHTRLWPNPNHLAFLDVIQARLLRAQGNLEAALACTREADQVRRSAAITRSVRRIVEADLVRTWLVWQAAGLRPDPGDELFMSCPQLLSGWRQELERMDSHRLDECAEISALALARVDIEHGAVDESLALLTRLTEHAMEAGSIGAAVESFLLTALAYQSRAARLEVIPGSANPGLDALEQALRLAESGGYIRLFLDDGRPVQLLLAQWLARASAGPLRDYAALLLEKFETISGAAIAGLPEKTPNQSLVEPLSPREIEVLSMISQGLSNAGIAQQLIVSPGTVKAHTASIYRKLDVANRTEAVARARQLHLLA